MTKHEVKEYLTKIYGMEVYKVETANFLGMLFVCLCGRLWMCECQYEWMSELVSPWVSGGMGVGVWKVVSKGDCIYS
mgnify:CR=1 FL=1